MVSSAESLHAAPRLRPWVTAWTAAALLLFLGWSAWLSHGRAGPSVLVYPAESAGRVMDRHLTFYEGYDTVPAWERWIHRQLFGSPDAVRAGIEAAFRELLDHFARHPELATPWAIQNTQARLLVLLGEQGNSADLDAALVRFCGAPEQAVVCAAVRYAYGPAGAADPPLEVGQALRQVPLGWSVDRLRLRVAARAGRPDLAEGAGERLQRLGRQWRLRTLALTGVGVAVLAAGLLALGSLRHPPRWRAEVLTFPLGQGLAVGVRSGVLGVVALMLLSGLGGGPLHPVEITLWPTLLASLPMVWLIHRHLLAPRRLTWRAAFGLRVPGVALQRLGILVLGLLALDWGGGLLIAWTGEGLGFSSHWSEGLGEAWIWPPWGAVLLGLVNALVWAPLFEEVGFRGLLYGSLRSRLGPLAAALASTMLFALLHGYGPIGTLTVAWSGWVLAFAYERTRSLLPGMVAHALANAFSLAPLLLFYR